MCAKVTAQQKQEVKNKYFYFSQLMFFYEPPPWILGNYIPVCVHAYINVFNELID